MTYNYSFPHCLLKIYGPKLLTKSISILSYIIRLYTVHHIPFLSAQKTASQDVRPKMTLGTKLHTLRPAM